MNEPTCETAIPCTNRDALMHMHICGKSLSATLSSSTAGLKTQHTGQCLENILDVSVLPKDQVHERKKRKPCPHCDHTSASSSNLRKHIAAFHEGENISLREKYPKNPLIMKSEPMNI